MQVLFKSRHPQATDLRDLTEQRVRFVLRRLCCQVPRSGIYKRCQVGLRTDGAGSVVVTSVAGAGAPRWTTRWHALHGS